MTEAMQHRGFAFLNVMSPCVTFRGDDQFKTLKAKLKFLPPDHDRGSRAAAQAFTRETDSLTTGVLYEVREPSLIERLEGVRTKALKAGGPVTSTAEVLRAFAPAF